jgi:hypothetical protein
MKKLSKKLTTVDSLNETVGQARQLGTYTVTISDDKGQVANVVVFVRCNEQGEITADHNFAPAQGHEYLKDTTKAP